MTKTSAPILTPKPATASKLSRKASRSSYEQNPGAVSWGLALNMAWQLAVVVLVPVVIGRFMDSKFSSDAMWTIIGLVIGAIGMILVVRQTIKSLNETMMTEKVDDGDSE